MSDIYVGSLISLLTSPSLLFLPVLPPFSSPIGGLQIRYDSSGSLPGPGLGLLGAGGGGGGETLPPVATSIEQLLERQWNEGQSFLLQHGAQGDGERTHFRCHTFVFHEMLFFFPLTGHFCRICHLQLLPLCCRFPSANICHLSAYLNIPSGINKVKMKK